MVTVVLDPASRAAAAARRTVHGMDPGLRGNDLPLDAGQELLALGQTQTQGAQIGKGIRLGNPHDIGAVFFALSSDTDQPHDPGHVASTSAGIQARKYLSGLAPPISRQSLLQSVRRLASAPADPVADNPATYRQAVARRDAVHRCAVSPLALQELQGVLPLRHRRSVSRLL